MTITHRTLAGLLVWFVVVLNLSVSWLARAQSQTAPAASRGASTPPTPAEAPNFTGRTAVLDASDITSGRRLFEAGARSNWHSHPNGQLILNESGAGLHQVEGGPIERLAPGDTAYVGRGIVHWHGAASEAGLRQVSIGFGGTTKWGAPVSDAEYGGKGK